MTWDIPRDTNIFDCDFRISELKTIISNSEAMIKSCDRPIRELTELKKLYQHASFTDRLDEYENFDDYLLKEVININSLCVKHAKDIESICGHKIETIQFFYKRKEFQCQTHY